MSRTITGAEFRDFYRNHWPKGCWHEDAEYEIEDEDTGDYVLPDDAVLDLKRLGYVVKPGEPTDTWLAFEDVWDEWKGKASADEIMTWRVPAGLRSQVVEFMDRLGLRQVGQDKGDQPPAP